MNTARATALLAALAGSALANPTVDTLSSVHPDADLTVITVDVDPTLLDFTPQSIRETLSANFVMTGDAPEGDAPSEVLYSPDGSLLAITHRESQNVLVYDGATGAFLRAIDTGGAAQDIVIASDSRVAYVANIDVDTVTIVDLVLGTVIDTISTGTNPAVLNLTPDGSRLLVANAFDLTLEIYSTTTNLLVDTIFDVRLQASFGFAPENGQTNYRFNEIVVIDNNTVAVADATIEAVRLFDLSTGLSTDIPTANDPRNMVYSAASGRLVVAHSFPVQDVTVIDVPTASVIGTVSIGVNPNSTGLPAMDATGRYAVIPVQNATTVVDTQTLTFTPPNGATASINEYVTTASGTRAIGIGFRGPVIDFATGNLVALTNNVVSTDLGDAHPTLERAAMVSTTFGEDLVQVATGASPALLSVELTGPAREGDRTRTAAVSADGSRVIGVGIISDSATVIDAATGNILAHLPTGMRPADVDFTPDGTKAVVANLDEFGTTVLDLVANTATLVPMGRRGAEVEISPDGQFAYVAVVADGDGVERIDLSTNTLAGPKLITGNMGSVGYSFSQNSDMKLSPDGATLAVAGSFDNVVTFIDTASWSVLGNAATSVFPTELAWSADSSTVYVSIRNFNTGSSAPDAVQVIDAATRSVTDTIIVGDNPYVLVPNGTTLYVANWGTSTVSVVDLTSGSVTSTIPLPNRPVGMVLDGTDLVVASGTGSTTFGGAIGFSQSQSGEFTIIDTATNTITDTINVAQNPALLSAAGGTLAAPSLSGDGVIILRDDAAGCSPADLSSPGSPGTPDGVLTGADFFEFLNRFNAGDLSVDFSSPANPGTPDGVLTGADFFEFLNLFAAGC